MNVQDDRVGDRSIAKGDFVRYSVPEARLLNTCMGLLVAVFGVLVISDSGVEPKLFGAFLVVLGLCMMWRGYASATLLVCGDKVITRSYMNNRCYALTNIMNADVGVGRTGMNGFGRQYLALELADGSRVEFGELNARPAGGSESLTVVQQAANTINERRSSLGWMGSDDDRRDPSL